MVQGLGFLSKKSWHTKNLANQEKVWIAEQRKLEEDRRTQELAKQIQQEREQEELAKIAGKASSQYDRGIDWMYNHGQECLKEDKLKEQEEYLLGKAIGSDSKFFKGDIASVAEEEGGVNKVLAEQKKHHDEGQPDSKPAATPWMEPSVAEKNEAFRLRMEDPMFFVTQKAREMEKAVESKARLYEKVTGKTAIIVHKKSSGEAPADDDVSTGEHRSERKRKHKRKSKHKKRSRHRSRDYSSDSSDDSYRRSSKLRRRQARSRSPSYSDDSSSSYHRRKGSDRRRDRSRTPERYRHREDTGSHHHSRPYLGDHNEKRRHSSHKRDSHDNENYRSAAPDRDQGYGLQGAKRSGGSRDLGPDAHLLKRRREEKEAERRRMKEATQRRNLTAEEKAEALREMEQDALRRRQANVDTHRVGECDIADENPSRGRATFLNDLTRQAHGMDGMGSLHERLNQNRNRNQRSNESFL